MWKRTPFYPLLLANSEAPSFNDNGSVEQRINGYSSQTAFIDREILNVVDAILQKSRTPPVIIQGDYGLLPDIAFSGAQKILYPAITPVNTFRVILHSYFGQRLPLLIDVSYDAPKSSRDAFEIIPNTRQSQP